MTLHRRVPPELKELFDADDRQREEFERWEYLREQKQRANPERLVHKTFDPNERRVPQQQTTSMPPEQDRAWNSWWRARFNQSLREVLKPTIAQFAVEFVNRKLREVKLPAIKAYVGDGRGYAAHDVVIHGGGCYQAQRDTARMPGHCDWVCLAAPGEKGIDGRDADQAIADLQKQLDQISTRMIDLEVVQKAKVIDLPVLPLRRRHAG